MMIIIIIIIIFSTFVAIDSYRIDCNRISNNDNNNINDNDNNINCNNILPIRIPVRSSRRKSSLDSLSFDDKNELNTLLRKTKSASSVSMLTTKKSYIVEHGKVSNEKKFKVEKEESIEKKMKSQDNYDGKIDLDDFKTGPKLDNIKNNKVNLTSLPRELNLNVSYDSFQNTTQKHSLKNNDRKKQIKNNDNDNNSNNSINNNSINNKGDNNNKIHMNTNKSYSHKSNNNDNNNNNYNNNIDHNDINKKINHSKSYDGKNPEMFFPSFFPSAEKSKLLL